MDRRAPWWTAGECRGAGCLQSTVLLTGETARRAVRTDLNLFGWDIEDFAVLLLQAAAANFGVLVLPRRKNVAMWGSDLDSCVSSDRWIKHICSKSKWNRKVTASRGRWKLRSCEEPVTYSNGRITSMPLRDSLPLYYAWTG